MTTTRLLPPLIALVIVFASGCAPATANGPEGTVTRHIKVWRCTPKPCGWRYRITVRPATGGTPVDIRVLSRERHACPVGAAYPACLPKED
ncbi:hypothetical protein [Nonomuraea typhae]|uniref:hypothetical protein n=1 Tax=Nonomuraea typhae TaxID=2603600 RepID=UPI0015E24F9B|nr:hypothetical protein [Nonomuraea typhae]